MRPWRNRIISFLPYYSCMQCHPVQYKYKPSNGVNAMYFAFLWSYRLARDLPVTGCRIKAVLVRAMWQVSTTAGCFLSAVPHAETSLILWASLSFCLALAIHARSKPISKSQERSIRQIDALYAHPCSAEGAGC